MDHWASKMVGDCVELSSKSRKGFLMDNVMRLSCTQRRSIPPPAMDGGRYRRSEDFRLHFGLEE